MADGVVKHSRRSPSAQHCAPYETDGAQAAQADGPVPRIAAQKAQGAGLHKRGAQSAYAGRQFLAYNLIIDRDYICIIVNNYICQSVRNLSGSKYNKGKWYMK
jgi:hypothetical protein